jgi:hypothetical protein
MENHDETINEQLLSDDWWLMTGENFRKSVEDIVLFN